MEHTGGLLNKLESVKHIVPQGVAFVFISLLVSGNMVNNNKRDNVVCFLPSTKGKVHLSPLVVKHSCKVAEVADVAADVAADVDIVKD